MNKNYRENFKIIRIFIIIFGFGSWGIESYGQINIAENNQQKTSDHPFIRNQDTIFNQRLGTKSNLTNFGIEKPYRLDHSLIRNHDSLLNIGTNTASFVNYKFFSLSNLPKNRELAYKMFKFKILALPITHEIPDLNLPKAKYGGANLLDEKYTNSLYFAIFNPVSFWYFKANKEERSKRKLFRILIEEDSMHRADVKFNREMVAAWTALEDETLTEFIVYCDMKPKYLLENTEYDIMMLVKNKLMEFRKIHNNSQIE